MEVVVILIAALGAFLFMACALSFSRYRKRGCCSSFKR